MVIGSIAELEQLSGVKGINDLHKDKIDHITIPSKKVKGRVLKRVPEVFDCWFESGRCHESLLLARAHSSCLVACRMRSNTTRSRTSRSSTTVRILAVPVPHRISGRRFPC